LSLLKLKSGSTEGLLEHIKQIILANQILRLKSGIGFQEEVQVSLRNLHLHLSEHEGLEYAFADLARLIGLRPNKEHVKDGVEIGKTRFSEAHGDARDYLFFNDVTL